MTANMPSEAMIAGDARHHCRCGGLADGGGVGAALHPAQTAGQRHQHAKKRALENAQQKATRLMASTVRCRYKAGVISSIRVETRKPPAMEIRSANKAQQRHHEDQRQHPGQDEELEGRDAERLEGFDFLVHLHRAQLRGKRGAGAATDDDAGHDAGHLARPWRWPPDPPCRWTRRTAPVPWRRRRRGSMPMRKLMSATMPSACGPHSWMTRKVSDQRNCARPRSILSKASTLSPMKLSIAAPPFHASRPDSPTRCRNSLRSVLARRVLLFRHSLSERHELREAVRQSLGSELDLGFCAQIVNSKDARHQGAVPPTQLVGRKF